jgi:hypothetical protein
LFSAYLNWQSPDLMRESNAGDRSYKRCSLVFWQNTSEIIVIRMLSELDLPLSKVRTVARLFHF